MLDEIHLTDLDFIKFSQQKNRRTAKFSFYDCSGDIVEKYVNELTENPYMSWTFRGKWVFYNGYLSYLVEKYNFLHKKIFILNIFLFSQKAKTARNV